MHARSRLWWTGAVTLALATFALAGAVAAPAKKRHAPAPTATVRPGASIAGTGRVLATVNEAGLPEISGCAVTANGMWLHNDSGNPEELFLINPKSGVVKQRLLVAGAANKDWEDMAAENGQLYIGDIGDNSSKRDHIKIYRLPEATPTQPAVELKLSYPDGSHNAEALVVQGGDAYIVTKTDDGTTGLAAVYRLRGAASLSAGDYVLESVGPIAVTGETFLFPNRITAADVTPDGRRVVLRTYEALYLLERPKGHPFASVWAQTPKRLEVMSLRQAEAVCVEPDGRHVITTGEGLPAPLIERSLP